MSTLLSTGSRLAKSYRQSCLSPKRTLASVASLPSHVAMSRFDKDRFIDYKLINANIERARERLNRPLTYSEKLLYGHLDNVEEADIRRGESYLKLRPSRIACQDATAQMALIQFMSASLDRVAVPTTIHCDHLIVAREGFDQDLPTALNAHDEVYNFSKACVSDMAQVFGNQAQVSSIKLSWRTMHTREG